AMSSASPGVDVAFKQLQRFLFMGAESNRYLQRRRQLSSDHARHIKDLIHLGRGVEVVREILRFSTESISICPEALAFALAVCAQSTDQATKCAAYNSLKQVCHSASLLFAFTKFMEDTQRPMSTGWGRAHRRAVTNWYCSRSPTELAEIVTMTVSRHRWSHRDVLRLAHVKPPTPGISCVFRYVSKGFTAAREEYAASQDLDVQDTLRYLRAVHELKHAPTEDQAASIIDNRQLAVEHIPTHLLRSRDVWLACLPRAPIASLLSWLPHLVHSNLLRPSLGLLRPLLQRISSDAAMSSCPWGPCATYLLLRAVGGDGGGCGGLAVVIGEPVALPPTPNVPPVPRQLQQALYTLHVASFKRVFGGYRQTLKPTNKRYLVVMDVRGTMWEGGSAASPITAIEASVLLVMGLCRGEGLTGGRVQALAFGRSGLRDLEINAKMTMADILQRCEAEPGGTASLTHPLRWAAQRGLEFDVIIVCTDRQCNTEDTEHPAQALKDYRSMANIPNAKFVTCAWMSRGFAVAPPDETAMMDVCCFDESTLKLVTNFANDNF
ncbi:60 kDa SS-A/Ro ribonucleoprotein-like, partial [Tropilaelaps mercedesae]